MPFRILKYQLAIMQKHLDDPASKDNELPLVVPLVFYNGSRSPYPYSCNITDLFIDKELYKEVELGSFKLVDLTITTDSEILKHGKIALLEILLKHISTRDLLLVINKIVTAFSISATEKLNSDLVISALSYVSRAREKEEVKLLIEQISKQVPDYKERVMTYEEALKLEGELRGELKGKLETARELLNAGVDEAIILRATHLKPEQLKNLK